MVMVPDNQILLRFQDILDGRAFLIEPNPRHFMECMKNRAFANPPEVRCAARVLFDFMLKLKMPT